MKKLLSYNFNLIDEDLDFGRTEFERITPVNPNFSRVERVTFTEKVPESCLVTIYIVEKDTEVRSIMNGDYTLNTADQILTWLDSVYSCSNCPKLVSSEDRTLNGGLCNLCALRKDLTNQGYYDNIISVEKT